MTQELNDDPGAELAARVLRSSRRALLCGSGAVAVAALLSACGSDVDAPTDGSTDTGLPAPSGPGDGSFVPGDGESLASLDQVPVGGGIVTEDLVIVQPTAGTVKAYDRSCPHQQNPVDPPRDGIITCPFHGSQFKADDGSLVQGPATKGLTAVEVKVADGQIVRA